MARVALSQMHFDLIRCADTEDMRVRYNYGK